MMIEIVKMVIEVVKIVIEIVKNDDRANLDEKLLV